jgi:hypothetical protein
MGALKKTLLFYLAIRLLAVPGYFLLTEYFAPLDFIARFWQDNYLLWSWANFDGEHYLAIAKFGYGWRGGMPQYAFFPLLPLLIKAVSVVVRDYYLAAQLVTLGSIFAIFALFPRWLKLIGHTHKLPLLALFLAPGAVFLGAIYTEPLFIALTLSVFVLTEKKQFLPAALIAGLATASRISGVFTAIFLIHRLIMSNLPSIRKVYLSLTSFLGLISYTLFLFITTGDALNWYHSQAAWGKSTATSPITTVLSYGRALTTELVWDLTHLVVFLEVALTVWAIYLFVKVVREKLLASGYILYLAGNLFLPIVTGSLGSMPRFLLILFPSFVAFNSFSPKMQKASLALSAMIMLIGITLFTRGRWFA